MCLNRERREPGVEFYANKAENILFADLAQVHHSKEGVQVILDESGTFRLERRLERGRIRRVPPSQLSVARQRLLSFAVDLERPEGQFGIDLLGDLFGLSFVGLRRSDAAVLLQPVRGSRTFG